MYNQDNITRGPRRWERAAINALRKPHSQAAELYRSRYEMALQVAHGGKISGSTDVPWEFLEPRHHYSHFHGIDLTLKRKYVTCGIFCTVMQVSLDFRVASLPSLAKVFNGTHHLVANFGNKVQKLDLSTLQKSVRCQVCAKTVAPR